jgi:hypothetical protein
VLTRIFALVAVVAGIGGVAFCAYAWVEAPSMAETLMIAARAGVIVLDAAGWIARWRMSCLILGAAATAIFVGGSIILAGRQSGFFLVAAVAASLAALPWIVTALGASRYAFEQGNIVETIVLGAIAVAAAVAGLAR